MFTNVVHSSRFAAILVSKKWKSGVGGGEGRKETKRLLPQPAGQSKGTGS